MGDRSLMPLIKLLNLQNEASSASSAYLFDTPLAEMLAGVLKVVGADNVLDLDEIGMWNELQQKGEVLDEATCDAILQLDSEDESDEDYDDIEELREQLRIAEERDRELSRQIAEADARKDILYGLEAPSTTPALAGCDSGNSSIDLDAAACVYSSSDRSTREIEAVSFEQLGAVRYLSSEEEFLSCLTSFSKQLLSTPMSLLDSGLKSTSQSSILSKDSDELDELQVRYREASRKLARGKMELKYEEMLSSLHAEDNSVSSLTKYDHESEVLRGKFSSVLEDASKAFVFCKDASDLDLQLARLRFCHDAKKRILEHLVDQLSRHVVFADLLAADSLFYRNLKSFLGETKESISLMTTKKSSTQRSLDVISSFANAPLGFSKSDLSLGFSALTRLVVDDLPPLVSSESEQSGCSTMFSIEEMAFLLADEWDSREYDFDAEDKAWANDLQKCGAGLRKMDDHLYVKSRALLDPRVTAELFRLKDQLHLAKKSTAQAVELSGRAPPKTGSFRALLAKAPVYFHTNPEKFDKLVRAVMES